MKQMITPSKTPRAITVIGYCLLAIVLSACTGGDGEQRRAQLEELERQNREYEDFTTDSLAKELVDYFDRHGTSNERMRAHYILGCVYRDLGEVPRAVDCYLNAISQADTTKADCNYRTMSSVYSQMAWLYHQQLLLSFGKEAYLQSSRYSLLAKDTLNAAYDLEMSAGTLMLMNKEDSAELNLKEAIKLYERHGFSIINTRANYYKDEDGYRMMKGI